MICALHLIWIIPLAGVVGFMAGVMMAKQKEDEQP